MTAPRVALRAKRGAGGGTRTHTTLPSRDFKSLASTSSATSAMLISLAFSAFSRKGFSADLLRFPFRLLGAIQAQDGCEKQHDLKPRETAGPINSPRCTDRPPRLRRSELSSSRRSVEMSCPSLLLSTDIALQDHRAIHSRSGLFDWMPGIGITSRCSRQRSSLAFTALSDWGGEAQCGAHERNMRKRLGKISGEPLCPDVIFLGQQTKAVRHR